MKAYYILKDNGVVFQSWEDQYLFELLSGKITQKLSRKYRIDTISKLRSCSEEYIENMPSTILPVIKSILKEYKKEREHYHRSLYAAIFLSFLNFAF